MSLSVLEEITIREKLQDALNILVHKNGQLTDDTYVERMITTCGLEIKTLSNREPELSFSYWQKCGLGDFVEQSLFGSRSPVLGNIALKLLCEMIPSGHRFVDLGMNVIRRFVNAKEFVAQNQINFYPLLAMLMIESRCDDRSDELLSLTVWEKFFGPNVSAVLTTHFQRMAFSDALSTFLSTLLSRFHRYSGSDLVCQQIFKIWSKTFDSTILLRILNESSHLDFSSSPDLKIKFLDLMENLTGPVFETRMFCLLLCRNFSEAKNLLISSWIHVSSPKLSLARLKVFVEFLHQRNITFDDEFLTCCEAHLDRIFSSSTDLSPVIVRLSQINSDLVQSITAKRVHLVLRSFVLTCHVDSPVPRDLTMPSEQKLLSVCLVYVKEKLGHFDKKNLWEILLLLTKTSDVNITNKSKTVDILGSILNDDCTNLEDLAKNEPLVSQLWHLSRSDEWEVLDSFLALLALLVGKRLAETPTSTMLRFVEDSLRHESSFIRAAATELLFEILIEGVPAESFDTEKFVWNVFMFEAEAVVRRKCARMLQRFDRHTQALRGAMVQALGDHDWEVKEEVLEYWCLIVKRLLSENKFEDFESFVRILNESEVVLALKISSNDFEPRHLEKTFRVLKNLQSFVRHAFPVASLKDIEKIDIVDRSPVLPNFVESEMLPEEHKSRIIVEPLSSRSEKILDELLNLPESRQISDGMSSKPKSRLNRPPLDTTRLPPTKDFLVDVLFRRDFDAELAHLQLSSERQIGLESLLDDIIQSNADSSVIDGVDCF